MTRPPPGRQRTKRSASTAQTSGKKEADPNAKADVFSALKAEAALDASDAEADTQ
jgi:hypothetical protein